MTRFVAALLAFAAAGCTPPPTHATVTIKAIKVEVEWLREDPARRLSPSRHSRLVDERGILAGFGYDRILHYWSKDASGGYDVLFLAADGKIVDRQALPAGSDAGVTSKVEARYALFLAEGWGARNNAKDADRVELSAAVRDNAPSPMPRLAIGGAALNVEISVGAFLTQRGLMHRRTMSAEDGMLFVYGDERERNFWMMNCHYPLDIAFFDKDGGFINVVPTDPWPEPAVERSDRSSSTRPAQYIVEAHKGWFKAKGLVDSDGKAVTPFKIDLTPAIRDAIAKVGSE